MLVHPASLEPSRRDRLGLGERDPQRRHHPRRRERQIAGVGVGREQRPAGVDGTRSRPDHHPGPGAVDRLDRRLLVHFDAGREDGLAEPAREQARVEDAAGPLEDAAAEAVRQARLGAVDELDLAATSGQERGDLLGPLHLPVGECRGDVALGLVLAVDSAVGDQALREVDGAVGEPDELGGPATEQRGEQLRVAADRRRQVPGVPRARPPAAEGRLEQHDVGAELVEPQRRGHPRQPAADHDDVAAALALESRARIVGRVDPAAE